MDVFDVIRMVLDLLGFDLFQLPVWEADTNGRHRNLVRRIGSRLPLRPARRPTFQKHLLQSGSGTGIEVAKQQVTAPSFDCATLADLGWINEQSFCNGIQSRSDGLRRKSMGCKFFVTSSFRDDSMSEMQSSSPTPPQPSISGPSFSTPDPVALQKINDLEDELGKLRQQIAAIVMSQEKSMLTIGASNNSSSLPGGAIPPCSAPPPPPPPCGAPPPPPPPPPVPVAAPQKTLSEIIKENKKRLGKDVDSETTPKRKGRSKLPNMSDVLKGLGSVKLKSVERSPGGTPLRRPPLETDHSDAASLIANALKKKFAKTRQYYSPNKENDRSLHSSPENSPTISAPSLLKPSQLRRKSAMFENRQNVRSPLAQMN